MPRKRKVDLPLRRDVRLLGEVLGEVLRAQSGERLFLLEEEIRKLAILRRRGPPRQRELCEQRLREVLADLSQGEAEAIVRAFAAYFQLVNLAEQHHRIRRARAHALDPEAPPQRGSLEAAFREAKEKGITAARLREVLAGLRVVLTFTAHPTQATRRTVLEKIDRIARELERRDRMVMTPLERARSVRSIREQVGILWQTREVRGERPTVASEVKNVLWYVENVLWDVLGDLPDAIADAFERVYGEPLGIAVAPVRIHSWAGGDMDGNPLVTPGYRPRSPQPRPDAPARRGAPSRSRALPIRPPPRAHARAPRLARTGPPRDAFAAATPFEEIGELPIGSRPAKRAAGGIEALRAIPWVFAWTQNRAILPGWYGVGSAFESFARRRGGWEVLEEMASRWPFFRTVLSNVEMVLAKTDLRIAREYAALAPPEAAAAVWPRIEKEYEKTVRGVRRLQGVERLLDRNPSLQTSIDLRNPYVDPMSYIQVEFLRRKRAGERGCDPVLLLTLNGIAVGMRNTG